MAPVALLTGGASWFSRETARLLIDDGWDVVLTDINEQNLAEVSTALNSSAVTTGRLDVTDRLAVKAYVDKLAAERGHIDALVNVAGGSNWLQLTRVPFHESDPANWDPILKPNLYGVLNCCHAVLPHMINARSGSIVTVSSGMGLRGMRRMALYSSAKAAVIGFTQSVCQDVGQYGVRMNCVAPGSAESRWQPDLTQGGTNIPPLGSRTSAKDVANAIVFLLSDKASHITGTCMDISGGSALH
jgi:2-hydroxycyclohexanecarboxyl-CoA dehydrogenase